MKYILISLLIINSIWGADGKNNKLNDDSKTNYKINYSSLKDTLFTTGDYFIEVNLTKQIAYLHSRNDSIKSFGVST